MSRPITISRILGAAVRNAHPSAAAVWVRDSLGLRRRPGDSAHHLAAAMGWLARAYDACGGRGIAGGYSLVDGWFAPYPETAGYLIPTFYDYAKFSREDAWRNRARSTAEWEIDVQMPNGAVQAGFYRGKGSKQVEAVFNTGQVILGWCRAFSETQDQKFLDAAVRAANWLTSVQSSDGSWPFASPETETTVHAYDVRTAWSLLEIFTLTKDERFANAAIKKLNWALREQQENAWFANNAFFTSADKWAVTFTHTIAYAMEGFQESYRILLDARFLNAYSQTAEKLMRIFELRHFMAGDFDENWKSSGQYACLTGNAQISGVWLKHFQISHDARFLNSALKLNDETKSTQSLNALHGGIRGGIKGSQPITGKYCPLVYPNWAAKFFADTLMLEIEVMKALEPQLVEGPGLTLSIPNP